MKLYTEEQVIDALWKTEHPFSDGKNVDEIMKSLTPIQLPSDEEIEEKAEFLFPTVNIMSGSTYIAHKSFIEGAKWMRDKILNK